jgi:phosphohistidine phosphatase SixA
MEMKRFLAGALALAMLAGCASMQGGAAAEPAYYVMRHLQKGTEGTDPALSAEGAANAQRLVAWCAHRPKPSAIYASATRRAQETAAPLAAQLGLAIKEYDPRDTPRLVARVKAEPGWVLVVGHSNTVPEIVAALGGARPAALADTDYGAVWVVGKATGVTEQLALPSN